nr:alpha/beta hydrolase [Gemmatimonadaceae bacterium]
RAAQWAPLLDPAIAAGHQVVACDAPGHGASDGDDAAMPAFRTALLAAVDRWSLPLAGVVGHSLGGLAALGVVAELAERDAAATRALRVVSIGAPATVARPLARFVARHRATPPIVEAMLARFTARWGSDFASLETEALVARCVAAEAVPALLVLHALDDEQVPVAEAGYLASLWPGAAVHFVESGGHSALLRDPTVVRRVLEAIVAR